MSATAVGPLVNGFTPPASNVVNEAVEYEKILKLRDQIIAGTHPRLSVPAHSIRKVSPAPATQSSIASNLSLPPAFSFSIQQQLPGLGRGSEEPSQDEQSHKRVSEPALTLSGIDPVLLTKSDDLVRAELQLLRQRLEKALRDQFEQKRLDARKKPALGEGKPDFDIAAILAKTLETTKLDTSSTPQDEASLSSFDENSLYSSRGPDSTPEAGELDEEVSPQRQASFAATNGTNIPVEARDKLRTDFATVQSFSDDTRTQYDPFNPALPNHRIFSGITDHSAAENDDADEEEEEGEYSPPEAMEQAPGSQDQASRPLDPRSRPLRRYSELENGRPGSPSDGHIRIVRNHITSPAAPQPSRVSPLAVAKDSMILQSNRARNGRAVPRGRGDHSPDTTAQALHPRKKRKLDRKAEKRRRTGGGSPDIKDEPVSPPPFHDVQPLGSSRLRPAGNEPIVIDDGPPETRYVRVPERFVESPMRPMSRIAEPMMPLSESRTMSRATMRPLREETDLRRAASLHSMRQEQPQYVQQVYDSPSRVRSGSYAPVDSPVRMEMQRVAPEPTMAYEGEMSQNVRVVRTPAPAYREVYQEPEPEIRYVSQPMRPPPPMGRIIVDEYGRKFREITHESPVVSRAASTFGDRERPVYTENYERVRAGSTMIDASPYDRYDGNMPPPARMMRPVEDSVRPEMYQPARGRAVSVAAVDHASRQPIYLDDGREYQPTVRVGSVRPGPSRNGEGPPGDVMSRASVRPLPREGSVFVEDRAPMRQEYIPMERPQYRVVDTRPRYVDAQGREIIMGLDAESRYEQRY